MKLLPKSWSMDTLGDLLQMAGVGAMALGVGVSHGIAAAIAVFALGMPILTIQRHMREQLGLNRQFVDALGAVRNTLHAQQQAEQMRVEALRDLHGVLKRVAEEGITRE